MLNWLLLLSLRCQLMPTSRALVVLFKPRSNALSVKHMPARKQSSFVFHFLKAHIAGRKLLFPLFIDFLDFLIIHINFREIFNNLRVSWCSLSSSVLFRESGNQIEEWISRISRSMEIRVKVLDKESAWSSKWNKHSLERSSLYGSSDNLSSSSVDDFRPFVPSTIIRHNDSCASYGLALMNERKPKE